MKTIPEYIGSTYVFCKNDVVYFEHNSEAVKSAESVGITSYFYDNDEKDLDSLKQFLDDNISS